MLAAVFKCVVVGDGSVKTFLNLLFGFTTKTVMLEIHDKIFFQIIFYKKLMFHVHQQNKNLRNSQKITLKS